MTARFSRLTPPEVKKLKPGDTIREHGVVVEKLSGDERWLAEFMYHRQRVHRVLGLSSGGWTRSKCVERIEAIKAELREGVSSLPAGRKTPLRFDELGRWYISEMEATAGKNVKQKRLQLERRLVPFLGRIVVDSLTEEHIGRYAKSRLAEGASPSTVNRDLATLSHVLSTAMRRKKLQRRPCSVPKLDEPEGRIDTISEEQEARLLAAARADVNPDLWLFVEFALNTSMRSSEMTQARFDQIDWRQRRLFIPDAKAGGRHQPLTQHLVDVLRKERLHREDKDGWIFASKRSATGHAFAFNGPFQRAVTAAGLDPSRITPHVMRHTAITRLVEAGTPLPTVQKISGHKTLAMVIRYTHVSDPHVDAAMRSLDRTSRTSKARTSRRNKA